MSRQLGSNNVLRAIGGTIHLHKARPPHYISVQLNSGLTNFSDSTDQANLLASKEKFSDGIFCFFFDAKKKEPFGGG
ncbi:hypothetical protein EZ456_20180 [Pedobacter psychrodurus]|uniref:Uncharacterized protein n=1 Tax=Pedobacter psychrodurus TaxID=2530456 RepID=A0A4R0PLX9_9SPHI|nr:hypothetical protein [Pedobacter psychrodurus]TCD19827.1 hypothetical protein EZ456_20180 [Pedobacter psychrodurus]